MEEIVKILKEKNKTISTMESCTGGYLANEITNISGASDILLFSIVTCSSRFKVRLLVSSEQRTKYDIYAISNARQMGKYVSSFSNSDYGIGIAGNFDISNNAENGNKIYISIYDKDNDKYYDYDYDLIVVSEDNLKNKIVVIDFVKEKLLEII